MHTVSPKKVNPLMFDNNFGKCGPTFKIISIKFVQKFTMYISQRFAPHLQHAANYVMKFENPKMLQILTA